MSLKNQFQTVLQKGWLPYFQEASQKFNFPVELLLGLASRETNLEPRYLVVPGDGGNGFGLLQIDRRSYPVWVQSGAWHDPRECILKGAEILQLKRQALVRREGQKIKVTAHNGEARQFTMPPLSEPDLTTVAVAAYNSGDWAAYHYSKGRSPDTGTTGGNYSADVLDKAERFAGLLSQLHLDTPVEPVKANPVSDGEEKTSSVEAPKTETVTADMATVPVPTGLTGALKAFGLLLISGWKRLATWIVSMGIGLDSGLFERHPVLIILLILSLFIAFGAFFYNLRKKEKSKV